MKTVTLYNYRDENIGRPQERCSCDLLHLLRGRHTSPETHYWTTVAQGEVLWAGPDGDQVVAVRAKNGSQHVFWTCQWSYGAADVYRGTVQVRIFQTHNGTKFFVPAWVRQKMIGRYFERPIEKEIRRRFIAA